MLVDHGPKGRGLEGMVPVAMCDALREHQRLVKHRDVRPLARVGEDEGCEMLEGLDVTTCLGVVGRDFDGVAPRHGINDERRSLLRRRLGARAGVEDDGELEGGLGDGVAHLALFCDGLSRGGAELAELTHMRGH